MCTLNNHTFHDITMANIFGTAEYSNDEVNRLIAEAGDEEEIDFLAQAAAAAAAADTTLITTLKADTNTFTGFNTFSTKLLVGSANPSGEGEALSIEQVANVDSALNGTIGGENVYNQFSYGVLGRKLYWAQGVDNTNLNYYLGYKNGGGPDPDYFLSIRTGLGMCIQPDTSLDPGNYTEALRVISKGANKALHIGGPSHFNGAMTLESGTTLAGATGPEIAHLSGVTSGLQSQLDLKADLASPNFTGITTFGAVANHNTTPGLMVHINNNTTQDTGNHTFGGELLYNQLRVGSRFFFSEGSTNQLLYMCTGGSVGDDPDAVIKMGRFGIAISPELQGTVNPAAVGAAAITAEKGGNNNFAFRGIGPSEFDSTTVTGVANFTSASNEVSFTSAPVCSAAPGDSTHLANRQYVDDKVATLVASAPATLDTLNELAAALGDDPNFATAMTNSLAAKAPLASPAFTGTPTAPYPGAWNHVATKQYADTKASPAGTNTWTGTNTFNNNLPTSTLTPTTSTQLVTKTYVDSVAIGRAPIYLVNGSTDEVSFWFPIWYTCGDLTNMYTGDVTGFKKQSNASETAIGAPSSHNLKDEIDHVLVMPGYGFIGKNGGSGGTIIGDLRNNTPRPIKITLTAGNALDYIEVYQGETQITPPV